MIELRQTLVQGLTQQMIMTPQMQQAIEMLQLCTIELEQYLEQQLTENPLLEEVPLENNETDASASAEQTMTTETPGDEEPKGEESERDIDKEIESLMGTYSDYSYEGRDFSVSGEDGKRGFIENTAAEPESMSKNLMGQLSLSTENATDYRIGEWIISEVDERGYFSSSIEAGSQILGVALEEIERVLRIIQTFTPTGIGARDLRDCLLIQIEASHYDKPFLKKIIQNHLEPLAKKQYPAIARALKISLEQVQALGVIIASLEPAPGRYFGSREAIYITPDVIVKKVDGEYVVYVNDNGLPRLRISSLYRKLLKNRNGDPKTKEYIRDKLRSAQWLVKNIQQRKDTIQKVAQSIIEVQRDFLDRGVAYLKPLTLKEIAEQVEMHESTISRVTASKYIETPRGIFLLKYFFSSGIENSYGEPTSSKSVKEIIRTLIEKEDKHKPLSDQRLTELISGRGFRIARRTIAKYREEIGILSSKYRREY
jgi:RNA polymerase sigma-54 factor